MTSLVANYHRRPDGAVTSVVRGACYTDKPSVHFLMRFDRTYPERGWRSGRCLAPTLNPSRTAQEGWKMSGANQSSLGERRSGISIMRPWQVVRRDWHPEFVRAQGTRRTRVLQYCKDSCYEWQGSAWTAVRSQQPHDEPLVLVAVVVTGNDVYRPALVRIEFTRQVPDARELERSTATPTH